MLLEAVVALGKQEVHLEDHQEADLELLILMDQDPLQTQLDLAVELVE
jgi:hypothetical protein